METSGTITTTNIFIQPHANLYNLLNNRSNVSDPNDSTGKRKFVYTREPNFMSRNFAGFPFIIVPDPEYNQTDLMLSSTKSKTIDEFEVIIYGQDKVSDSFGDPSGRETVASISSSVLSTVNSNASTLRSYKMKNRKVKNTDFDWGEVDGKNIFKRIINFSFSQWRSI